MTSVVYSSMLLFYIGFKPCLYRLFYFVLLLQLLRDNGYYFVELTSLFSYVWCMYVCHFCVMFSVTEVDRLMEVSAALVTQRFIATDGMERGCVRLFFGPPSIYST